MRSKAVKGDSVAGRVVTRRVCVRGSVRGSLTPEDVEASPADLLEGPGEGPHRIPNLGGSIRGIETASAEHARGPLWFGVGTTTTMGNASVGGDFFVEF